MTGLSTKDDISVFIIADIEGSSGCFSYEASSFKTKEWPPACRAMSLDVNAVVQALLNRGITDITIKDFHRTGYNLLPELIDPRAKIVYGYKNGDVPGIGTVKQNSLLFMIGMHASSGSGGFLAHTLTSRIAELKVNGRSMPEAELFAASLAPFGGSPVFFSGCPVACKEVNSRFKNIMTYAIDKTADNFNAEEWRQGLAESAMRSLKQNSRPYHLSGPFEVELLWRDGKAEAIKIARRWKLSCDENRIYFCTDDFKQLYETLIRICYLRPAIEKILPLALPLYNLYGLSGRRWVRKQLKS